MDRIFNEQLEKIGVDYFDYYLIHNIGVNIMKLQRKLDAFIL